MAPMLRAYPLCLLLLVTACGRADGDAAAGGLTVGESETLERAAERLEARPESPGATESRALEDDVRARLDAELVPKNTN